MNVFKDFENRIKQAVQALDAVQEKGGEVSFERLAVEPPRDPAHGDISTNAAMVLAKPLGMNPRALADMIAAQFADDADVAETAVAGPGFLNFRLTAAFWRGWPRYHPGGNGLRAVHPGCGPQGQCRVCFGQSDRADACRPLPRCGCRRCAGEPDGVCRL
jgi:hypothetical protein